MENNNNSRIRHHQLPDNTTRDCLQWDHTSGLTGPGGLHYNGDMNSDVHVDVCLMVPKEGTVSKHYLRIWHFIGKLSKMCSSQNAQFSKCTVLKMVYFQCYL